MVNIGAIWGLALAVIFLLVIYKKMKQRTEKEVEVINVIRPDEKDEGTGGNESEIGRTESGVDEQVAGKQPKGKSKRRRRIQDKSSKTDSDTKRKSDRNKERTESVSPADSLPEPEPFEG